jgi:hypothetical protein
MNMPDMSREFLEGKCLDLARANIFGHIAAETAQWLKVARAAKIKPI